MPDDVAPAAGVPLDMPTAGAQAVTAVPCDIDRLRARLDAAEQPLIGCLSTVPSVPLVRQVATVGLDFVMFDCEHYPWTQQTLADAIVATSGTRCAPVVRLASLDEVQAAAALDAGAVGIWIPNIRSAEEAQRAAAITRYPPLGRRGVGPTLALSRWELSRSAYLEAANKAVVVCVVLESAAALAALPEILRIQGIDLIQIGRADLAADLGHLGHERHPAVRAAVEEAMLLIRESPKGLSAYAGYGSLDVSTLGRLSALIIGTEAEVLTGALRSELRRYTAASETREPSQKGGNNG